MFNSYDLGRLNECEKLWIKFKVKDLDIFLLKSINNIIKLSEEQENTMSKAKFNILEQTLCLENNKEKYTTIVIYRYDMVIEKFDLLFQEMCITSKELGFIISPMIEGYKDTLNDCYKVVQNNKLKLCLHFNKLNKGFVYLTVDLND